MSDDVTQTAIRSGAILPAGTVLADRYSILRLLGVGAMGMVYLARDDELGIDVAIKILRPGGSADDGRLQRFRSELVLARQISHRNVVRIHDIGQSDDATFITMDFVDGQSLKQILELEQKLEPARAVAIACDIADALAEAHRAGVVHRDIKPANVMLGKDRAYLTDFGIARSLHTDGLTRTGDIVGTLDYLAPEQARGESVDGRADIYALGLVLFEMLTGKRLFQGKTAAETLAQRTLAQPRSLTRDAPGIPPELRPVLERCLAVDVEQRYQAAGELAADLRSGTVTRRRPSMRWPVAGVVAVAVAAVSWFGWQYGTGPEQPPPQTVDARVATARVAVLPFDVAVSGGDGSMSRGIAELLSEQLGAAAVRIVPGQRVYATMSDLKLDASELGSADLELLADLLDAELFISGRLQQIGSDYSLQARIQRAGTTDIISQPSLQARGDDGVFQAIAELGAQLLQEIDVPRQSATIPTSVPDAEAMRAYTEGVEHLAGGSALAALEPLQRAVRDAPGFTLAWDRLAQALAATGRDGDALRASETAVSTVSAGGGRLGAIVRARYAALAGEPGDAIAELTSALQESPDDTELRYMLAEIYGDSGQLEAAAGALQRVVANSPDHPQAWYLLGKFAILSGNSRRAADDYLVKALVIQNRLGNLQGRADALNALGIAEAQLGNSDAALDFYSQARDLREQIGDDRGVAAVIANMARIDLDNGRYAEARAGLVAARDRLKEIGDRWTVANLDNELGFLAEQRADYEQALAHYREALGIRRDLNDARALAESYNNVSYAYFLLGAYDNADVFNKQSLDIYRDTENDEGIMLASQTAGILETARGRYDVALKALLESLQLSRDLGNAHATAIAYGYIGRVRQLQGQFDAAAESYADAIEQLTAIGDERGIAEFSLRQAQLSLDIGDWSAAERALAQASPIVERDENAARKAMQQRVTGDLLAARGASAAGRQYADALQSAEASGEQVAILQARLALAAFADGNLEEQERLEELGAIHTASARLGHGHLQYESSLQLARALLRAGRAQEATAVLQQAGQNAHASSGHGGDYRLFALLAAASGDDRGSQAAWDSAAAAVRNARERQTPQQWESFRQLPLVQEIMKKTEREQ